MKNERKKYHIPLLLIRCFLPESTRAQGITDELDHAGEKYQHISPTELCGIIDLLSPSTDDYLYFIDFRTDFYYIAPQSLERFCVPQNAFL